MTWDHRIAKVAPLAAMAIAAFATLVTFAAYYTDRLAEAAVRA